MGHQSDVTCRVRPKIGHGVVYLQMLNHVKPARCGFFPSMTPKPSMMIGLWLTNQWPQNHPKSTYFRLVHTCNECQDIVVSSSEHGGTRYARIGWFLWTGKSHRSIAGWWLGVPLFEETAIWMCNVDLPIERNPREPTWLGDRASSLQVALQGDGQELNTLWWCGIAMENSPFKDYLPTRNGDFHDFP